MIYADIEQHSSSTDLSTLDSQCVAEHTKNLFYMKIIDLAFWIILKSEGNIFWRETIRNYE